MNSFADIPVKLSVLLFTVYNAILDLANEFRPLRSTEIHLQLSITFHSNVQAHSNIRKYIDSKKKN